MKTEQLIQAMAADAAPGRRVEVVLPVVLVLTAAVAGVLYFLSMGVRVDLSAALTRLPVLLKQVLPWVVAGSAFAATVRLSRPDGEFGVWGRVLVAVPIVLGVAMIVEMLRLPVSDWVTAMKGTSLVTCITSIPLLSVPIAAASLWALRGGASTRPRLTGWIAGIMSAGTASGIYAFYCNDDSPLFYGIWYVLAVLLVALITGAVGARVLRW